MALMISVIVAIILTTSVTSLKAPLTPCSSSTISQMGNVSINVPCNDEYCTFHKGMNTSLTFTFNLQRKIHKVRAKVLATIGSFDHNFALPNSNVCQQLKCPHQKSIPYTYHNSMYVSPSYPSVKVNQMRYYLTDSRGREFVCISPPVMITENNSKQNSNDEFKNIACQIKNQHCT